MWRNLPRVPSWLPENCMIYLNLTFKDVFTSLDDHNLHTSHVSLPCSFCSQEFTTVGTVNSFTLISNFVSRIYIFHLNMESDIYPFIFPPWFIFRWNSPSTPCGLLTHVPVSLSHRMVIYLYRWHTHRNRGFSQAANTHRQFKRSRTSEIKERDERGRGRMAPSGCRGRETLRKCRQRQPCRQGVNYRLDGQVTITWTGSLSLSVFVLVFCLFTVFPSFFLFTSSLSNNAGFELESLVHLFLSVLKCKDPEDGIKQDASFLYLLIRIVKYLSKTIY